MIGRTSSVFAIFLLMAVTIGMTGTVSAQSQGQGNGRIKVDFDDDLTPLQREIGRIVGDRRDKGKPAPTLKTKCSNPNSNNPKCDADEIVLCTDCGELTNPAGKPIGRRNRTETIIEYDNARQRGGADKFDRIRIGNRGAAGFGAGPGRSWQGVGSDHLPPGLAPGADPDREAAAAVTGQPDESNPVQARVRRAQSGLGLAINNDQDCIDTVTGDWFQGGGCFDGDVLIENLVILDNTAGLEIGCEHVESGEQFLQSPTGGNDGICFDEEGSFKKTTLEELIDEDGPDFAGNPIDQDSDGQFDEDPSESGDVVASCEAFYESEGLEFDETSDVVDGQCDMSRAFMVQLNRKAKKMAEDQGKNIELAYAVDEQGRPLDAETARNDPRFKKAKQYGEHGRRVRIREDFTVRCRGNEEFIDGECVGRIRDNGKLAQFAFAKAITEDVNGFDRTQTSPMLMGFTFAPPVVEWGYKIEEEVCVNLLVGTVCAEVFFARIGYEFDIAAGMRLPIEVQLSELPPTTTPGAIAQSNPIIRTTLEPKDFTVGEFTDVCLDNNLSSDCTRFAFPEFLDSFNPTKTARQKDGSELVARETIFAGIQVRTLGIPLINWAVDSDVDLMAMCTMLQIKADFESTTLLELAQIGTGLVQGDPTPLLNKVKASNCASFTTPFGFDEKGDLRTFPFTQGFDIRADCAEAMARGEVINIKGKPRPICTGLVLGTNGASLGVGLGVEASLGSTRIDADWRVNGDAVADSDNQQLIYRHNPGSQADVLDIELLADNYQDGAFNDKARIELDDFTYLLNTINLALSAKLEFGGILSPIPDIASFKLFDLVLSGDEFGIPIGQHAGMDPIQADFFVRNYALTVDGKPAPDDTDRVDDDTLLIKPGEVGSYQVRVTNRGSVTDSFDNFRAFPSNQPDQTAPFSFTINPNTDLDCQDPVTGDHYAGNPYDGVGDNCYTSAGPIRNDREELIDEDPLGPEGQLAAVRDEDGDGRADEDPEDVWVAEFTGQLIEGVAPYAESTGFVELEIVPFRHPLTAPGIYPVQILADSVGAKANGLDPNDPVGQSRVDAEDVIFIEVDAFYDPLIVAQPLEESGKPGVGKSYTVEVSNGSNVDDVIKVATDLIDYNQAGCTLTTMGKDESCPFRATPTAIALAWTNGELLTPTGLLAPLGLVSNDFTIDVPSDWAGMEDTTYQFRFTVTSTNDPEEPPASNQVLIEQTVVATMESMTRYIGLQLDELIAVLREAQANGIATKGLEPISVQAVQRTNNRALDLILGGNLRRASRTHASNIRIVEGFVRALAGSGKKLPPEIFQDLNDRVEAILQDQAIARDSLIPSA